MIGRLLKLPLWQPLKERPFRLLWAGSGLAMFADQVFLVALTLLALRVSGPGFELGSVLAAASVPRAVFMLAGGWVSDRFSPALSVALASVARAAVLSLLALVALAGGVEVWHLYVFAGALGLLDALYYPAALAAVPALVDASRLRPANALVQGAEQVSAFVGPALAASSVALLGFGATFGSGALMFGAAALAFLAVLRTSLPPPSGADSSNSGRDDAREPGEAGGGDDAGFLPGFLEGVRYSWRDPVVRAMLFVLVAINLTALGPVVVGGAALAEERLGGAGSLGILLSAFGAGSVLGILLSTTPAARLWPRGPAMLGASAVIGASLAALGFVPNVLFAAGTAAVMGVGSGYLGVVLVAWLQERVEPAVRGRVMALVVFAVVALDPVSYALAGALLEVGTTATFAAPGALMLLVTTLFGAGSTAVRTLR